MRERLHAATRAVLTSVEYILHVASFDNVLTLITNTRSNLTTSALREHDVF